VLHRAFPDTPHDIDRSLRGEICVLETRFLKNPVHIDTLICAYFAEMNAVYSVGVEMYISYSHIVLPFTSGTTHRSV
jgi:hypothetical protein